MYDEIQSDIQEICYLKLFFNIDMVTKEKWTEQFLWY